MSALSALRTAKKAGVLSRVVIRNFCRTSSLMKDADVPKTTAQETAQSNAMDSLRFGARSHAPNRMEKTFLVWSGRYKSVEDVPATVPEEAIEKARNKARIRIANFMMAGTIIACIFCIISGKQAAARGESVHKQNLDWHRQYNESAAAAQK